jgi:predicted O-methyltransferase YrrM
VQFPLRRLAARLSNEAHHAQLSIDWGETRFNRVALLNAVINLVQANNYLEIGCADDETFHAVPIAAKVGVDPARGGTHRMTSDAFFSQNNESYDVIFVDGLHHHEQIGRDIGNALDCLSLGGVVVVHDCLPVSFYEQAVPQMNDLWTGDVWKAVFEVKERRDVDLRVALIDHGCGIIVKRPSTDLVSWGVSDFASLDFAFYVENWERLGILSFSEAVDFLVGALTHSGEPQS